MERIKIALADDQQLFRVGICSVLAHYPHFEVVAVAENGQALWDALPQNLPDVVLMDLKMPLLNGIEASKRIRARFPFVKIIILTAYQDEPFVVRCMELGICGYLFKDTHPDELVQAIESVVRDGIYLNKYVSAILVKYMHQKSGKAPKLNDQTLRLQLTGREVEVLLLICQGLTTAEIAERLFISINTVEGHRKKLLEKTGVSNAVSLAVYAIQNDLVKIE